MQKRYHMSNKYLAAHFLRFGILLVLTAGLLALDAWLGLTRWSAEEYEWVAGVLMATAAFGIWARMCFGGFLDGKNIVLKLVAAAVIFGAVGVAWFALAGKIKAKELALPFFVVDVVLLGSFLLKTVGFLSEFWKGITSTTDGDGNEVEFPAPYLLEMVHTEDSVNSPIGNVLINGNTVMFIITCRKEGQVYVTPGNSITILKPKTWKDNEMEETSLNEHELLWEGEKGALRMLRLVEAYCKKNNIPVPVMNYNFAIFMPRFRQGNLVLNRDAFRRYGNSTLGRSYKKYVRKASEFDLFCGKAAFDTWQIKNLMTAAGSLEHSGDAPENPQLVAEILAEACHLVPAGEKK